MTTKHEVIEINRLRPDFTDKDIARVLECHDAYVRATARRYGLVLKKRRVVDVSALREKARRLLEAADRIEAEQRSEDSQ